MERGAQGRNMKQRNGPGQRVLWNLVRLAGEEEGGLCFMLAPPTHPERYAIAVAALTARKRNGTGILCIPIELASYVYTL